MKEHTMNKKISDLKDNINLEPFQLDSVKDSAHQFNDTLKSKYCAPFPRLSELCLSWYQFSPTQDITILEKGQILGGISALVTALFDLSWFRSIVAHLYSSIPSAQPPHDPASLFCLLLMACLDGIPTIHDLCLKLQQPSDGQLYRDRAGIALDRIPCEATFTNFVHRIGEGHIREALHLFVSFFLQIGLVSSELLSTDGRLVETFSRFRGCNYACERCACLDGPKLASQILEQLNQRKANVEILCPFPEVVEKVREATKKKGKEKLPMSLVMQVSYLDAVKLSEDTLRLARVLGVSSEALPNVRIRHSRLREEKGQLCYKCHKMPADLEAKTGYHIDPKTGKAEAVFGFNEVTTTAINTTLGLELPVEITVMPGNGDEAGAFPLHRQELSKVLPLSPGQIHALDSGYDQKDVYEYLWGHGVKGIIDYNPRRENQSEESQQKRGYDINGVPFAPCGRPCHSNGYWGEGEKGRRMFVCRHGCQREGQGNQSCPYFQNQLGFSKAMKVIDHPRLVGPVLRGGREWCGLYAHRTASERVNSYDATVMRRSIPLRVMGLLSVSFKAVLRTLGQLLRRGLGFILEVTRELELVP
jgi:hypothetical protein